MKTLPKGMKKYSRPDITKSEGARNCFPTSLLKQAADLAAQTASSNNIAEIKKQMEECFPVLQLLLREKKCVKEILFTLPHLTSYDGDMVSMTNFTRFSLVLFFHFQLKIHDAFYRLKPQVSKRLDLSAVLGRGLLLSPGTFNAVEDGNLLNLCN